MYKRLLSIFILITIIIIGFSEKELFIHLIKEGGSTAIIISVILVAICVFFPIIPFPILAGMIGAVFGTFHGVIVSLTGSMVGTMCFFFLCRYGFKDWAQAKLKSYPKVQEYENFLAKHSFLSILVSRLIPIIPAPVVNMVSGLSSIKWPIFFAASALGKIPNVLLISYAGAVFEKNKLLSFGLYGAYMFLLFVIYLVIYSRRKIKED